METFTNNEVHHLTFEEYKKNFKKNDKSFYSKLGKNIIAFLSESEFLVKFAFAGIILILLMALVLAF